VRSVPRSLFVYALLLASLRVLVAPGGPTSWDEANGCFGLWSFDVLQHRPHPPGYPLWILTAQPLQWWTGEPHLALVVLSALASSFAALPMWALARAVAPTGIRATGPAWAAAALYTLHPIAWSFGSRALSGALAMVWAPLLVLWLLRARTGQRRALLWASAGLGIAGGFRQDLLVFLLPLWFLAWKTHRGALAPALALLGVAAWAVPLVLSSGGLDAYLGSTDYMHDILAAESLLAGGSPERAAATAHRVLAATVLAIGPLGLWALVRSLKDRAAIPATTTLLWSAGPALLFCVLGYFHKKAYLFPALPALTALTVFACWRARWSRVALLVQLALWAGLYFALPSAERIYRRDDGSLATHAAIGFPGRLAYPWLEDSLATVRARDTRRAHMTRLLAELQREHPDLTVWVEPGARFSMREAMWAAPEVPVLERPLTPSPANPQRVPITLGQRGEWRTVDPSAPRAQPSGPVLYVPAGPFDGAAAVLGGTVFEIEVAPWFSVLLRP